MCSTWGLLCPLGRLQRLRTQHLCIKLSCLSKGVLDLGPAQADEAGIRPCAPSVTALGGLHVKRHARPGFCLADKGNLQCFNTHHKCTRLHAALRCKIALSAAIAAAEPEGNGDCPPASPKSEPLHKAVVIMLRPDLAGSPCRPAQLHLTWRGGSCVGHYHAAEQRHVRVKDFLSGCDVSAGHLWLSTLNAFPKLANCAYPATSSDGSPACGLQALRELVDYNRSLQELAGSPDVPAGVGKTSVFGSKFAEGRSADLRLLYT